MTAIQDKPATPKAGCISASCTEWMVSGSSMVMTKLGTAKMPATMQRRRHWRTVAACRLCRDCTPAAAPAPASAWSPSSRSRCCSALSNCFSCVCVSVALAGCVRRCSSAPKPTISTAATSEATRASSSMQSAATVMVAVSVLRFTEASATPCWVCRVLATVPTHDAQVMPSMESTNCPPQTGPAACCGGEVLEEKTVAPNPISSTAAHSMASATGAGPASTSLPCTEVHCTCACSVERFTSACSTPGTDWRAEATDETHDAHVMPSMFSTACLLAAKALTSMTALEAIGW